ncbi:MAG: hypothetical protein OEX03_00260 [Gammaproteobacteria bacterium]|nr:hypothetical protein [Gammaproteobacteria bacterium]
MSEKTQHKNMNCYEKLDTLNEKLKELARLMSEMNRGLHKVTIKN